MEVYNDPEISFIECNILKRAIYKMKYFSRTFNKWI